jgi:two-component system aerobic respiration control sensor histidine kinase ArcB
MSTLSLVKIIEYIDEIAIYIRPNYDIIAINAAAASFFACDRNASIGKNLLKVCSENQRAIPDAAVQKTLSTGNPMTLKVDMASGGKLCWRLLPTEETPNQDIMLLGKYSVLQDDARYKKDMELLIKQVKEVTGQDVEKNLSLPSYANMIRCYYERLIDHMPHNVYWLNKDCVTLGCNRNVLRLVGLDKKEQFVGITYEEMGKLANWTEGQAESFKRDDMQVMRSNIPIRNVEEPPLYDDSDNPVYYLSSREPLYDDKNEIIGVVGISVDISDKKKAQELAKQNAISEKIIQTLKTITGSLSHEIRTPLTGIRLGLQTFKLFLSQLLEERQRLLTIPEIKEHLNYTLEDIEEKKARVDKLIDKIDEGNALINLQLKNMSMEHIDDTTFRACNITDCILDAIDTFPFKYAHERELIHVDISHPFIFWGDSLLTRHVFWNLLSNALHFIREESKGEVTITTEKVGNEYLVHVKDTASGMPPEVAARIFEQFYTQRRDGTGLGLSFCDLVMKAYGGSITCQAEMGEYAEFTLHFPELADDDSL